MCVSTSTTMHRGVFSSIDQSISQVMHRRWMIRDIMPCTHPPTHPLERPPWAPPVRLRNAGLHRLFPWWSRRVQNKQIITNVSVSPGRRRVPFWKGHVKIVASFFFSRLTLSMASTS